MKIADLRIKPPPKAIDAVFHALSYMPVSGEKKLTIQETIDATCYMLDYLTRRGLKIVEIDNESNTELAQSAENKKKYTRLT